MPHNRQLHTSSGIRPFIIYKHLVGRDVRIQKRNFWSACIPRFF